MRLSDEDLAEIRKEDIDPRERQAIACYWVALPAFLQRRKLLGELDATRCDLLQAMAERNRAEATLDAVTRERDEALKLAAHEKSNREECTRRKRNEHARTVEIAALSKKAGWESCREAAKALAKRGERDDVEGGICAWVAEQIDKLQPPQPADEPTTSEAAAPAVRPPAVGPRVGAVASGAADEPKGER